jgi:murein L,D-transpeptidase YcbB/YkuD
VIVFAVLFGAPAFGAQERKPALVEGEVRVFYERIGNTPVWIDAERRPTREARNVVARLRAVGEDGLSPDDYDGAGLEHEAAALAQATVVSSGEAAAFDGRLTASTLRYFRDLHLGRVEPRGLGFHLDHALEPHDFPALLHSAISGQSFDRVVAGLRPPFAQYRGLRQMLRVYQQSDQARANQIALAMERLRWLPDLDGAPLVVVNIPAFHVWGWDAERADGVPAIDMAVIVGRAGAAKTPVFTARMTAVVLNPYWNVPDSIARSEILPLVDKDPGYLARHHMEMTSDGVTRRIRQLPGPWNALGQIKFEFPNPHGVYLHGTPAPALFLKERRDFSHGCVRVADPLALAEWVLARNNEWSRARISAAIADGSTRTVAIAQPPRIVMFYMTAVFVPDEGTVRFVEDVYGHDARLDAWLKARNGSVR